MTAWEIEDVADHVVESVVAKAEQTMTAEQRVDFLWYLHELVDQAFIAALLKLRKH